MTLARAVQLLRKEFGPNSFGSKKLLLFGGSSVRFAWFAGSFCHSLPRQAMQSMPGMLSKLESDFQERAKAIDTLLEQLRVGSRLLGKAMFGRHQKDEPTQ